MTDFVDGKVFGGFRLSYFSVVKLFDEFTYQIPLNNNKHVTAIIAPIGMGKTLCLRMIDGFFQTAGVYSPKLFSKARCLYLRTVTEL